MEMHIVWEIMRQVLISWLQINCKKSFNWKLIYKSAFLWTITFHFHRITEAILKLFSKKDVPDINYFFVIRWNNFITFPHHFYFLFFFTIFLIFTLFLRRKVIHNLLNIQEIKNMFFNFGYYWNLLVILS